VVLADTLLDAYALEFEGMANQVRTELQFKNNYFTELCCGSEAGSYLRLIHFCTTQL